MASKVRISARILSALIALSMLLCMFSCSSDNTTTNNGQNGGATPSTDFPFPQTNYGLEFNILYPHASIYRDHFFAEYSEGSDSIKSALQERDALVENYLGVKIKATQVSANEQVYADLEKDILSGNNTYELVLVQSYHGIAPLITAGYMGDLYELDDIDLEADYWNLQSFEALEVGGKAHFGLSDFMLADPTNVYFNKAMAEEYHVDDLYKLVREGKWTMEELIKQASKVNVSNPTNAGTDGTYGFAAKGDWHFISFLDSCDVTCIENLGGFYALNMSSANQRYMQVYEYCEDIADADWSYLWDFYSPAEESMKISDGKALFMLEALRSAYSYRDGGVAFGILPYPKLNVEQEDYRSYDWCGAMGIPISVQPASYAMVGQTLECLAFYSKDTVHVAYYEKLLGARLADAPDDAEMIEKYIFDKIVLNPTINFIGKANTPLGILVYTIPKMLRAKYNNTEITTIAVNWANYRQPAQDSLDSFLNKV